jgi:hypothetical protein
MDPRKATSYAFVLNDSWFTCSKKRQLSPVIPNNNASARRRRVAAKTIRLRDKDHCKFVASQPCIVCGRTPSEAHHIRFAQPRALGRKVSDEYSRMRRLAKAHRSTRNDHLHRNARLGSRRSAAMTLGMSAHSLRATAGANTLGTLSSRATPIPASSRAISSKGGSTLRLTARARARSRRARDFNHHAAFATMSKAVSMLSHGS